MPFLSIQLLTEGGTTIPAPGDYFVEPGSTHVIKAVAYEGYEFAGFIVIGGPQHGGHNVNPISVTVPDDVTVLVYALFKPKPKPIPVKPPDFILVRYEWRPFPEGTFPFTLDDVRRAWRFVYTVKNVGGKIGEF
ncbi:MAG: hypothetical protein QXV79_04495, partial [Thermofilaceae archaeon]